MIQFNLLVSFHLNWGGGVFPETAKTICVYIYLNKISKGKSVAYAYCPLNNNVKKKKKEKEKRKCRKAA